MSSWEVIPLLLSVLRMHCFNRWIGLGGLILWRLRVSDSTPFDFGLHDFLVDAVSVLPVPNVIGIGNYEVTFPGLC
jgi:hypothetical protein